MSCCVSDIKKTETETKTQHRPRKQRTEAGLATLDSTGLEFLILGASARRHRKNYEATTIIGSRWTPSSAQHAEGVTILWGVL